MQLQKSCTAAVISSGSSGRTGKEPVLSLPGVDLGSIPKIERMAATRLRHPGVRLFFPLRHQCQRKDDSSTTSSFSGGTTAPKVTLVSQERMVRVKGQPPRVRCTARKNYLSPRRQQPRSMITAAVEMAVAQEVSRQPLVWTTRINLHSLGIAPVPVPGVGGGVIRSRRADGRRFLCPRPPSHRRGRGYTIIPTPCPSCLRDHRNRAAGPRACHHRHRRRRRP